MNEQIVPLQDLDLAAFLALNNEHAAELSYLDADRLDVMLGQAAHAIGIGPMRGALIAFDQDSAYPGQNFLWFRARHERFLYVDRVVVAPSARGLGLARLLYADLFAFAAAAGQSLVTCEVNSDPANPASDAFHAKLGFRPVGSARLAAVGKTVTYLAATAPLSAELL